MITDIITFIIHLRKDTEERKKNIDFTISYYNKIAPNSKIIIVEDDIQQNFAYLGDHLNIDYVSYENDDTYNKCKSYNIGLQRAETDIVCFLDADCIVSEDNIRKSIQTSQELDCMCIGYNGVAIYLTYTAKEMLYSIDSIENIYDTFETYIDKAYLYNEYKTDMYKVGNVRAVGGCLVGTKRIFEQINGFNPLFIGWGYEDNEIIQRAKTLGVSIVYINTTKPFLFHLPHGEDEAVSKSAHAHYINNYNEYKKIISMSKKDLEEYIKTW